MPMNAPVLTPFTPRRRDTYTEISLAARHRHAIATKRAASRIALVGGFTPRRCGIATFTADMYHALKRSSPAMTIDVYAMTPSAGQVRFDSGVIGEIAQDDPSSFIATADRINASGAQTVWLQHEFGLYGGPAGSMILELTDRIAAPLIVSLHTVMPDPDPAQLHVMNRLIARASMLIVMSEGAKSLLQSVYGAHEAQIDIIPHGVPDRPFGRSAEFKRRSGFGTSNLLMTFALLSPGKGIEVAIRALPEIVSRYPDSVYCIAGATHPNLIASEGEAYRNRLRALAADLGVEDHIRWVDAFLETEELLDLLEAADIYITPYPGAAQATSGTLSYAVALGKAVVSTPYAHATELLADDSGVLVPFNDSAAIAREVSALLGNRSRLQTIQMSAYRRGREMIWPAFAARCLDAIAQTRRAQLPPMVVTSVSLNGLLSICDDTGILQHSIHAVPDRTHGYCIDDNARALMLLNRLDTSNDPQLDRLTATFASFVQHGWNPDTGAFRNFMSFSRTWLEEKGSEDSCGRALWALGSTTLEASAPALRLWAEALFNKAAPSALSFVSPRATAFSMLGADYRLAVNSKDAVARSILEEGADRLHSLFVRSRRTDWPWFETRPMTMPGCPKR
jgi:glycosyltransferase involved in cell wall biosynthesis